MSKEAKLMRNTMLIAFSNVCTKFVSFFMMPLYTSLLTTAEYGVIDMISTYTSLIAMGINMQLEQGVFRFLVEARGNPQKQKEYISSALVMIFAAIAVFVLFAIPILGLLNYAYAKYLIISAVVNILSALLLQIPRGLGDNKAFAVISCVSGSSHVILNVLFIAVARWGLDGMLQASILSHVLTICLVLWNTRLWEKLSLKSNLIQPAKEMLAYSLPLVPYVFTWWIINASDRMIINAVIGVSFNGIYAVANKFASTYTMVSNIFQLSWTEAASENVNDKDRDIFYQKVFEHALRFYTSSCMGIIALTPFVFQLLIASESYKAAYMFIPILLIAAMLHAMVALYGSIYFALKKTKIIISSTFVAAIVNVVINVILIGRIGLYAAALSTLIAYGVILLIRYNEINNYVQIRVSRKFLIRETVICLLVLISYYSKNTVMQLMTLFWLVPYCCWSNKTVIIAILQRLYSKMRK